MKISRLIIPDFQQFKDFDLDLTYPEGHEKAGEPLDKVCFIGGNGTGKSTLLQSLNHFLRNEERSSSLLLKSAIIKFTNNDESYFWIQSLQTGFSESFENNNAFEATKEYLKTGVEWGYRDGVRFIRLSNNSVYPVSDFIVNDTDELFKEISRYNSKNVLIYSPAEASLNSYLSFSLLPKVTLDESLSLFNNFPFFNLVSNDTINDFWKLLIYHLKKRENDFREFEEQPDNQVKTVKEVRELFEKKKPSILKSLAKFWDDKILAKVGLEFDYENARNPVQLNDNLIAFIRLKDSKMAINYHQLSTGIRNFIFKLGHIYALYFNRNIESGFLLVDEPENSLFPDFLYDLVDVYTSITKNTQIFMATHNPIIAAQFQPYERFILEFEEGTGHVKVRRGTTPVGDDPNDILIKDFGIRSILGREGVAKWERYIELKTLIPLEHDPANKNSMIEEFMQIGSDYNFAADAVS